MTRELSPQQQIQRFETLNATRQSRIHLVDLLSTRINVAGRAVDRIRLSGVREAVRASITTYSQEISVLEPMVVEAQVGMAGNYLEEDRAWQRNLKKYGNRIDPDELAKYQAEYNEFKIRAGQDPNILAGLRILEERKKKEEDEAKTKTLTTPFPVAPVTQVGPQGGMVVKTGEEAELDLAKISLGEKQQAIAEATPQEPDIVNLAVEPDEAPKNSGAALAEEAIELPDVGFTPAQQHFASFFPLEEGLVVSRPEIMYSEYERKGVSVKHATDRFIQSVLRIQGKLVPAGFSIINFEADKQASALLGIRRLADYEGLLETSNYIPKILPPIQVDPVPSKGPIEAQTSEQIDVQVPDKKKLAQKEARVLMEQISKTLRNGVSLDPVIMQAVQEAHDEIMGVTGAKHDTQSAIESKSSSKRITSGLEDFLPELPVEQGAQVKVEVAQVIPFEQREENKIQPEERYLLGFVFELLSEAKARNEQYINNDDFKARLKPRREYEHEGVTFVESYSTNDIIRLFGTALEKLIKESQQPLIQWDEETRALFHSITTYAGEKGKNVENIRWPLRNQLKAIGRALDMGSRRIKEKD